MTKQFQSEAIDQLASALAKAQAEMKHAEKGVENTFFKSRYADLPKVIDASRPYLAANGLSVTQMTDVDDNGKVTLVTQLNHASGQWVRSWYPVNPIKNDPQGLGSAVTYARRYSYCAITGVAAIDEDDDGNGAAGHGPERKPEAAREAIFPDPQARKSFADACLDQIGKTASPADLKTVKETNLAKWNAMGASKDPADTSAWNLIKESYNAKMASFKAKNEPQTVAATVYAAVGTSAGSVLGNDTIAF
jgi:hypothetical protein